MTRLWLAAILVMPIAASISRPTVVRAQDPPTLTGRWSLNRELSQFPSEIGFNADWMSAGSSGDSTATGGRGQGGAGGGNRTKMPVSRESREDSARVKLLTEEVRQPSAHLTIVETATDVTITADSGSTRTFHPAATADVLQLDGATVNVTARREAGRLVVLYKIGQGRDLRYTYSRIANPPQLVVDVQFVEPGKGDAVRRVYEPALVTEAPVAASAPAKPVTAAQDYDRQPDAQLKGLTKLGVVVESLSAQAVTCGLRQDAIESLVTKRLSGAGLKVALNSDEDTYLYLNVMTATMANGLCISRYDAYLYTHTTARLEYHDRPVLVDVSLLHKGSIAAGSAAAHAESVMRGLQEFVDQFTTRIRDANK